MGISLILAFINYPIISFLGLFFLFICLSLLLVGILLLAWACLRGSNWQRKPRGRLGRLLNFPLNSQYAIQQPGMAYIGTVLLNWAFMGFALLCSFALPFWLSMLIWTALTALSLIGFFVCEQNMRQILLTSELPWPEHMDLQYLKSEYLADLARHWITLYWLFPWGSALARGLGAADGQSQFLPFLLVLIVPAFILFFCLTLLHRRLVIQWYLERQQRSGEAGASQERQRPLPGIYSRRELFGLLAGGIALWVGGSWWLWSRCQTLMPVVEESIYLPTLTDTNLSNNAYWSQDLRYLAISESSESSENSRIRFWDQEKKRLLHQLDLPLPPEMRLVLYERRSWSPNDRYFYYLLQSPAASYYDMTLVVFDPFTGTQLSHLLQDVMIEDVAWSADGAWLAAAAITTEYPDEKQILTLYIWEASSGKLAQQVVIPDTQGISAMAWSPDNHHLAFTLGSNRIKFWDVQTNKVSRDVISSGDVSGQVSWSPDGSYLAFQGDRFSPGPVTIMNYAQPLQTFPLEACTYPIAWSPDGHFIAALDTDKLVVWSLTEQKLVRALVHEIWTSAPQELYWSHDGSITSINLDGLRQVWRWS